MVAEGVSTYDLEEAAEKIILEGGARPAFKGYPEFARGNQVPVCAVCVGERCKSRARHAFAEEGFEERGDITVSIDTGVQLNG